MVYGLGTLASKLVGFILIPLYTTYFSIADYGIIGLVEVSSTAIISIFGLALYQALYRWYWDQAFLNRQGSIFFTILAFLAAVGFIINLMAWTFDEMISASLFGHPGHQTLVRLFFAASGLQILIVVISTVMQLRQQSLIFTLTSLAMLLVQLVLTLILIIVYGMGIEAIYYAQVAGSLVYLILAARFTKKHLDLRFEKTILHDMLIFSFPLIISNIAALVLSLADRYLLRVYSTMDDLGVYQFGYKIANTLQVLVVSSAGMALTPLKFMKMNDPDAKRFYSKILTYSAFVLMFLVLFVTLFGFEIVKVLAKNKEFWPSSLIIPVVSFGIFFGMLKDNALIGLQIIKKTKVISLILMLIASFSLLLNWIIIPTYGSEGAAWVFLASQIVFFIASYLSSQKVYPVPYESKKLLMLIGIGLVFWILSYTIHPFPLALRLLIKFAMLLSFPFILLLFNFYDQIELMHIRNGVKKWSNLRELKRNVLAVVNRKRDQAGSNSNDI
ncbi:MAG: oligosaccharide flippase family protein [Lentimicrobiaceae bacterium]|nr:oligosaccharide flippase family protein [Lentimicrobiaceae bacterium]